MYSFIIWGGAEKKSEILRSKQIRHFWYGSIENDDIIRIILFDFTPQMFPNFAYQVEQELDRSVLFCLKSLLIKTARLPKATSCTARQKKNANAVSMSDVLALTLSKVPTNLETMSHWIYLFFRGVVKQSGLTNESLHKVSLRSEPLARC